MVGGLCLGTVEQVYHRHVELTQQSVSQVRGHWPGTLQHIVDVRLGDPCAECQAPFSDLSIAHHYLDMAAHQR